MFVMAKSQPTTSTKVPSTSSAAGDNCCLAKMLLQNLLSFATRSRRKAAGGGDGKENVQQGAKTGPKTGGSLSTGSRNKMSSTEFSVCDSIDDDLLRRFSALPPQVDQNEWMACQMVAFFNHVNALYGVVSEFCTTDSCSVMSCPGFLQLPWVDEKGKKWKYTAPQYIDCAMSFCEKASCSEQIYPTKYGNEFSQSFEQHAKREARLLWYCLGHLYTAHWPQLCQLSLRAQMTTVCAHLHIFCSQFKLLDAKDLLALRQTCAGIRTASKALADFDDNDQNCHQDEPMDTSDNNNDNRCAVMNNNNNNNNNNEKMSQNQPLADSNHQTSTGMKQQQQQKSGSWGGVPSPSYRNGFLAKVWAQTC